VLSLTILLLILVAVAGSGIMSVFMFSVLSRLRQLESSSDHQPSELPSGQLNALADELSSLRDQLEALEQRTEFQERLLEGRDQE
jgi:hypothetical protein